MEELEKMNLYQDLIWNPSEIEAIISELKSVKLQPNVRSQNRKLIIDKRSRFIPIPSNLRAVALDFEGDPPFLMGLMIHDELFFYYITNKSFQRYFYLNVFTILRVLKRMIFFSFSNFEKKIIDFMYRELTLKGYKLSDLNFIKNLKIYNIQESSYESLTAALCKLNFLKTGDPLSRKSELINNLFELLKKDHSISDFYFDIILEHNYYCLINMVLILVYRFLEKIKMEVK